MKTIFFATLLTLVLSFSSAHAGDVVLGKKVAKKCASCHTFDVGGKNKVGPNLFGILGRGIAEQEGYRYSKAFLAKKEEGLVWNKETLDAYLTKPKKYIKKTKMAFVGLKEQADRDNLIAYLETLK